MVINQLALRKRYVFLAILIPVCVALLLTSQDGRSLSYLLLGLAVAEIFGFRPLYRHWSNLAKGLRIAILIPAILVVAVGLIILILTALVVGAILEPAAPVLQIVFGLALCFAEFFAVRSLIRNRNDQAMTWRWWNWLAERSLRTLPGEDRGNFWMALLWLILVLAIILSSTIVGPLALGISDSSSASPLFSLAIIVAAVHWLRTQTSSINRMRSGSAFLAALFLAAVVYLLPGYLPILPQLMGASVPSELSRFGIMVWGFVSVTGILALVIARRKSFNALWKLVFVGIGGGAALSLAAAYPVFTHLYNNYVPGIEFGGTAHERAVLLSSVTAAILPLMVGPISVMIVRPTGRSARFFYGAAAGVIAGIIVFAVLIAPATGIAANSPMYNVTVTRQGYGQAEWLLILVNTISDTLWLAFGAGWLVSIAAALLGGFTGVLAPARTNPSEEVTSPARLLKFVAIMIPAFLIWLIVINVRVIDILVDSIDSIFNSYGIATHSNWVPLLTFGLPWLVLVAAQIASILILRRGRKVPDSPGLARIGLESGCVAGLGCLLLIGVSLDPAHTAGGIISIGLSLEIILSSWHLYQETSEEQDAEITLSLGTAAGVIAAFPVTMVAQQLIIASLNIVLIPVAILPEMAETGAVPPGVEWLHDLLSPLFWIHGSTFVVIATMYALVLSGILGETLAKDRIKWWKKWISRALYVEPQRLSAIVSQKLGFYRLVGNQGQWITASPVRRRLLWVVLAIFGDFILGSFPILTTAALTLIIARQSIIEQLRPLTLGAVLGVAATGIMHFLWQPFLPNFPAELPVYEIVTVLTAAISFRALLLYTPEDSRIAFRLILFTGIAVLAGLAGYLGRSEILVTGGVARYDGEQWTVYDQDNSALGTRLRYRMIVDNEGRLLFGGHSGVIVEKDGDSWQPMLLSTGTTTPSKEVWGKFSTLQWVEDSQGRLWVGLGTEFGIFDPEFLESEDVDYIGYQSPGELLDPPDDRTRHSYPDSCNPEYAQKMDIAGGFAIPAAQELTNPDSTSRAPALIPSYRCLELNATITALARDQAGNLWLGTESDGIVRLEGNRPISDAQWEYFTVENSLPSNDIRALIVDNSGLVWAATLAGLIRFDGNIWETIAIPGGENVHLTTLAITSQGDLWVGAKEGAYRFDGQNWTKVESVQNITTFEEDLDSMQWIGTEGGLIRYDLNTGSQTIFDSGNSGLAVNRVEDVLIDKDGNVWVSTFTVDHLQHSSALVIPLWFLFFGFLFYHTYQGFREAPETRAQRLGQQILSDPDSFYSRLYATLSYGSSSNSLLGHLETYFRNENRDTNCAVVINALTNFSTQAEVSKETINQIKRTLTADIPRRWAQELRDLYGLMHNLASVERIADVTHLELAVNPSPTGGSIAIHSRDYTLSGLPPFSSETSSEVWRCLEQIATSLQKYQEVDDTGDKLSYLAEALAGAESTQRACVSVPPPEGGALTTIADRWRSIITDEIHVISGRADLRLELRSRQMRRAEEVTLALHLQNTGRSAAENIVIRLQASQDFSYIGHSEFVFERLPAGRTLSVEFTIQPNDVESIRAAFHLEWKDRVSDNNEMAFADAIRFYEVTEGFRNIPNPYIVGHPVKSVEMFFGRDDVFSFIDENLSGSTQDRTIVIYGQRRTGKTSILYQLIDGRLGESFIPVLIDMQEMAMLVNRTGDFLGEIAYQITRTLRKSEILIDAPEIDEFATAPTRLFNRFLDKLEDELAHSRLLLIFDEFELIESKISEGKMDADVLGYFRSLVQHRSHLVFIFTGTHRLEEMSHDYWSILFNIALYRHVSYLNPVDATALIRRPVSGNLDIDDLAVEKIFNLTRGHAYFIQLICWALVNTCNKGERNYATINDVNDAVQEILTTGEAHFAFIWQQADDEQRLVLAALAHTLKLGNPWARVDDIIETLVDGGTNKSERVAIIRTLDELVDHEVLEVAKDGALRFRFQLEVFQLWIATSKSVASLVERRK